MTPVIQLAAVGKRFGTISALDGVSLEVRAGELVGLLGPNGAGKTTLLRVLEGLLPADSGTVRLCGEDPRRPHARLSLGATPQETALPDTLRVRELLRFVSDHYPHNRREEVIDSFALAGLLKRQVGALSGGQKRRVAVALAFIGAPRVVLLDEPTTGLDVEGRHALWQAIRSAHTDHTAIVITSHYIEEVEVLAQRVVIMDRGRTLMDRPTREIVTGRNSQHVHFTVGRAEEPRVRSLLRAHACTTTRGEAATRFAVSTDDPDSVVRLISESGLAFREISIEKPSLESAFLAAIRQNRAPSAEGMSS
ncbi:ABC transporter ATP-binding protein [Klugiella xanthotipulae]|uniref:ABC-2 type transport system ATP-binding protein n=1 Tax=Klugiella xanthotipulae TaxID=244735 RepID=A0A543HYV8_9MICO|nr:ABC transporter ATP-binding protein [Klugiella xanthotipulae]TQM63470.1 ABC-2 type transport system ATP-binding protein [Klugiella xanthotipulae]